MHNFKSIHNLVYELFELHLDVNVGILVINAQNYQIIDPLLFLELRVFDRRQVDKLVSRALGALRFAVNIGANGRTLLTDDVRTLLPQLCIPVHKHALERRLIEVKEPVLLHRIDHIVVVDNVITHFVEDFEQEVLGQECFQDTLRVLHLALIILDSLFEGSELDGLDFEDDV